VILTKLKGEGKLQKRSLMEDNPLSSFISYLSSRGLSENSIKAFSSDVKEYLAFNGQPTEWFDAG